MRCVVFFLVFYGKDGVHIDAARPGRVRKELAVDEQRQPRRRAGGAGGGGGEKQALTCSEHSVFGKFGSFCERLGTITRLYEVVDRHNDLFKGQLQGLLQDEDSQSPFARWIPFDCKKESNMEGVINQRSSFDSGVTGMQNECSKLDLSFVN